MKVLLLALLLFVFSCAQRRANWSPEESPLPYIAHLLEQYHRKEGRLPRDLSEALRIEPSATPLIPQDGIAYRWILNSPPGAARTNPELAGIEIKAFVSGSVVATYSPTIKLGRAGKTWLLERRLDRSGRQVTINSIENCRIQLAQCILEQVPTTVADQVFGSGDWKDVQEIIGMLVGRCESLKAFSGIASGFEVRRHPGSQTVEFRVHNKIYSFSSKGGTRAIPTVRTMEP